MPPAEADGLGAGNAGVGRGGRGAIVVWRVGEALLAVPLESTVEIAAVASDGLAVSRSGRLEPTTPPGIEPPRDPTRAVIVRAQGGVNGADTAVALAADEVEGVVRDGEVVSAPAPAWLSALPSGHLAALIHLAGGRIAALLAVDALGAE